MERLIGRVRECQELQWAMDSQRSEMIILYGRRRVGKTFLVRRFFDDKYSFHFVGAHRKSKAEQLKNFCESLSYYSHKADLPEIDNWHDAFRLLARYLESSTDERKVLFFDEMPWIDTQGSEFSETPYTISKEYEEKLKARRNLFMEMAGVKRGAVITFVTPAGVSQSIHSSIVHSQLTSKHLFADVL